MDHTAVSPRGAAVSRRGFLSAMAAGTGAVTAAVMGCRQGPASSEALAPPATSGPASGGHAPMPDRGATARVPVRSLREGARVTVPVGDRQVEVLNVGGEYEARVLLCTHQGCPVAWDEDQRRYLCPCHEGVFDERGQPQYGPPTRPLLRLPLRVDGQDLLLSGDVPAISAEAGR